MEILFSFPCLKSAVKEMLQYKFTPSNISRHSSFASAAQAATACSAAKLLQLFQPAGLMMKSTTERERKCKSF